MPEEGVKLKFSLFGTILMGDPVKYINFFHTACHRAAACCPRWAAAW